MVYRQDAINPRKKDVMDLDKTYFNQATAVILAGGQSRRMKGKDKTQAPYRNKPFLFHALDAVGDFNEVILVTSEKNYINHLTMVNTWCKNNQEFNTYGHKIKVVKDIVPDSGPVGGIHTALKSALHDRVCILSIDTPLVQSDLVYYLLKESLQSQAPVTVPCIGGRLQPLVGVYSKTVLYKFEEALKSASLQLMKVLGGLTINVISEKTLVNAGFSPRLFTNINTFDDLADIS